MSPESHDVFTEKTAFAIHAFMTRYFILISISNCSLDFLSIWGDRNTVYKNRDSGDQKMESLCVSWWSLLYNFFLAYSSSCSIDQKYPTAPRNGPNHHPNRLSTGFLILAFPPFFSIGSYNQEEYSLHKKSPRAYRIQKWMCIVGGFPLVKPANAEVRRG